MRDLTIQVTISIFKTLALSNVAHMALVTEIPKVAILELNNGGLENVDILSKIIILLYS